MCFPLLFDIQEYIRSVGMTAWNRGILFLMPEHNRLTGKFASHRSAEVGGNVIPHAESTHMQAVQRFFRSLLFSSSEKAQIICTL
jgi:hypothetical protein